MSSYVSNNVCVYLVHLSCLSVWFMWLPNSIVCRSFSWSTCTCRYSLYPPKCVYISVSQCICTCVCLHTVFAFVCPFVCLSSHVYTSVCVCVFLKYLCVSVCFYLSILCIISLVACMYYFAVIPWRLHELYFCVRLLIIVC